MIEEEAFETEDESIVDALVLFLDNSAIYISRDSEDSNEDDMAIDSGEEMEVESEKPTEQTIAEESLSCIEVQGSGDKANYLLVINTINWWWN